MIVPRIRLILLAAAILPAAGLLSAWRHDWTAYAVASVAFLVMIATLDSVTRRGQLNALTVTIPEVIRLTVDNVSQIQVVVRKPETLSARLRLGLALPHQIASEQDDLRVLLEKGPQGAVLDWSCRAMRRGRYDVERCHLEVASALGLWALRRRVPVKGEVRAYPNLISGQQQYMETSPFARIPRIFRIWHWLAPLCLISSMDINAIGRSKIILKLFRRKTPPQPSGKGRSIHPAPDSVSV